MTNPLNDRKTVWIRLAGIAAAVFVIAAVGFFVFAGNRASAGPRLEVKETPVETIEAEAVSEIESKRWFTGVIKAARSSNLSFERTGILDTIPVAEGDEVKANEPLAILNTENLEAQRKQIEGRLLTALAQMKELENGPRKETIQAAKSDVEALAQQLKQAEQDLNRRKRLYDSGAISIEEMQKAQTGFDTIAANKQAAVQRYNELNSGTRQEQIDAQNGVVLQAMASLEDIEAAIRKSTIRAPFDGRITRKFLDDGEIVNPGASVIRIVESSKLEAWIGVPPLLISSLESSSSVKLNIQGETIDAKLKTIIPEIDARTRTQQIVFELSETQRVVPGQIVRIECTITKPGKGFWIPTEALVPAARGTWNFFVAKPSGHTWIVQKREVDEKISTNQDRCLIRAQLYPGEKVISSGVHKLVNGQQVRPIDR